MRQILASLSIGVAIGAIAIYYLFPRIEHKIETKTKVETQVQVRTVTRTVKEPGGRVVIEQETTDNSKISAQSQSVEQKLAKPNYMLSLTAGLQNLDDTPVYGLNAQVRVFGPIFAGAYGRTDGEFGLSVSLQF